MGLRGFLVGEFGGWEFPGSGITSMCRGWPGFGLVCKGLSVGRKEVGLGVSMAENKSWRECFRVVFLLIFVFCRLGWCFGCCEGCLDFRVFRVCRPRCQGWFRYFARV